MTRVVPSGVVSTIDNLFGAQRPEVGISAISIHFRDKVRTLLSLLQEIDRRLISVPLAEYVEFLQCQSALISALSLWDAEGRGNAVAGVGGKDPVERIRRILSLCPDENPPAIPDLAFITDENARGYVAQDITAAWINFQAGEWKGATVFAAISAESLLFWKLSAFLGAEESNKLKKETVRDYVKRALGLQLILDNTAALLQLMADARNLIHAGKVASTGLSCNRAAALTALAALEAVQVDLGLQTTV